MFSIEIGKVLLESGNFFKVRGVSSGLREVYAKSGFKFFASREVDFWVEIRSLLRSETLVLPP